MPSEYTQNLEVDYIAPNQASKEVTANAAFDAFDGAIAGLKTVTMDPTFDYIVPTPEGLHTGIYRFIGEISLPLAIILPQNSKQYYIANACSPSGSPYVGNNLTIQSAAESTNVGGGTITGVSDGATVTYTYTGMAGAGFIVGNYVITSGFSSPHLNLDAQILTWTPATSTTGTFTVEGDGTTVASQSGNNAVVTFNTVVIPPVPYMYMPVYCDGYNVFGIGTPITLSTNGTGNFSQNTLNFESGSGVSVTNTGAGTILFTGSAPFGGNVVTGTNRVSDTSDLRGYTVFTHIRGRDIQNACSMSLLKLCFGNGNPQATVTMTSSVVYKITTENPAGPMQGFGQYTLTSCLDHQVYPLPPLTKYFGGSELQYLTVGSKIKIAGFSNSNNNTSMGGSFSVVSAGSGYIITDNSNGVAETPSPTTGYCQPVILNNQGGTANMISAQGGQSEGAVQFSKAMDGDYDYIIAMYFASADNPTYAIIGSNGDTFANDGNRIFGALYSGDATNLVPNDPLPTWTSYGVAILGLQLQVVS